MQKLLIPSTLCLIAFTGCTTVGTKNLDDFGKYISLKPGVSTKNDVYDRFGQPGDVVYQGTPPAAPSLWKYYNVHARVSGWSYVPYVGLLAGGVKEESQEAAFTFDKAARLTDVKTSKDSDYVNQWVGITKSIYRINTDQKASRVQEEMGRLGKPFDKKFARKLADRR